MKNSKHDSVSKSWTCANTNGERPLENYFQPIIKSNYLISPNFTQQNGQPKGKVNRASINTETDNSRSFILKSSTASQILKFSHLDKETLLPSKETSNQEEENNKS